MIKMELQKPEPNTYGLQYFGRDACTRARDLLWEHLTDDQKAEYVERGFFHARGKETGDSYLINGGIRRIRDAADFCLHVTGVGRRSDGDDTIPFEDQLLALKILIERDEDLFLRTANFQGAYPLRR